MDLSAAHLRGLELKWNFGGRELELKGNVGDSEVLRICLSIVSRSSSLEELKVCCGPPGEHSLVAESPCSACCSFTPVGINLFEWLVRPFC